MLAAETMGVVVGSDDTREILLSATSVCIADEFHTLEFAATTIPWSDVNELRLLPPGRGAILARVGSFAMRVALGNVWAGAVGGLGYRLEVRQAARTTTAELRLRRDERRQIVAIVAWVNEQLLQGRDLSWLESGQPFWREPCQG